MLTKSASIRAAAPLIPQTMGLGKSTLARLKNLMVAGVITLVLHFVGFLQPIDQLSWVLQSKLSHQAPSGDIVFVMSDRDLADPRLPTRREELADALTQLNEEGVGRVYIDIAFTEPSNDEVDTKLANAIASLGPRAFLVERIETTAGAETRLVSSSSAVVGNPRRVVSKAPANWMGFVWTSQFAHEVRGERVPSLSASLAGVPATRSGSFAIDYAIESDDIPATSLESVLDGSNYLGLTGRTVVIGSASSDVEGRRVPGHFSVPSTYVAIYAAESLKAGRTGHISALPTLLIYTMLFALLITAAKSNQRRYLYYALLVALVPAILYAGALLGIRLELSYCAFLVISYASIRSRARWKHRTALVDRETNLPKLQALEEYLAGDVPVQGHIVVARVHGFEHVLKTLKRGDRAHYILKLVDRLRAAESDLTIYSEGHHLAWHSSQEDSGLLAEHLEGMRAMFAAPLNVAGSTVDAGISFGVAKLDGEPGVRLAAAVAAAEESSEALQPIKLAESSSRFDELWDISLRARIDEAMEAGEIFCVYQPKVDTRTGTMTGVEALVRWQDPSRGFIPPMHFIAQCEKAGRMEALTQYVLEHACAAGRLMHFRGKTITMAVNISATLLSDMRIVGMVRNVVQASGFDPRFLVLEVTETSRIGNLQTAEMVLNELKALGARISMDDFGVGETNFETFFELPFDELKIDRLFVANMAKSAKARSIVTSIVNMGRDARIGVVAEGAEDEETLKMLTDIGCTHVQGYVLARPMSLENLMEFNTLDGGTAREA